MSLSPQAAICRRPVAVEIHPRKAFGSGLILKSMLGRYRQRSILALVLMIAQSFLYNSVFFTFGLILAHFYRVPDEQVGLYLLPLAIGNFCGPLMLGSLFDTVGRKKMIAGTFATSGIFARHSLHVRRGIAFGSYSNNRMVCDILFCICGSQFRLPYGKRNISPRNPRAGYCLFLRAWDRHRGGTSPLLFGWLIESGSPWRVSFGYGIAALLLLLAAGTELKFGIDAEGKSLESIAEPLSS